MLTAKSPFKGEDVADTLANVVKAQPDWAALSSKTPASIRRLLRRCLERDAKQRLAHMADARLEIDDVARGDIVADNDRTRHGYPMRFRWLAVGLAVVALGSLSAVLVWHAESTALPTNLEVSTPATAELESIAVSPDGRTLIFAASDAKTSQLWIRSFDASVSRPLAGTEDDHHPFTPLVHSYDQQN